ncbi:glycoside hydrolase family 43 protein [Glycomyces xiaoerkulensis]|uniref:glycoside hydrolase family 43 protein n=1 Tax=Glycomyces xiaoerkulensis TaxID=2038139 RepID=UPI0018E4072F|nr:glycoside hydrolase family 43 protein [Glycomyces xiaoerkulensis]
MSEQRIRNPILPGFHPDPSIVRVGEDYYLATSTFEWCPGVRLHHSRDLRHWRPLGGIADSPRLLDLTGVPDSGGVWAPDLTHANGRFHLVYSVMDSFAFGSKDCANYLITAEDVEGPWSDPIRLPGRGFDAALFHDDDGSTWLLNMIAVSKPGKAFSGIEIQRLEDGAPAGEPHRILADSPAGITEGPHLYRRDGWYYLLVAEGGTGYGHGAIVARSRDLTGPYGFDPNGPLITSRDKPYAELQKAGHGSLVETPAGEWYLPYLTGRPYNRTPDLPVRERDKTDRCVLGRETAIAPVHWADGWPRVAGAEPAVEVPAPDLPPHPWPEVPARDDFEAAGLDPRWSTLRRHPDPGWLSLEARPSHLRITGGQSAFARRAPSLVAQRVTARRGVFEAGMEFDPATEHQVAGVVAYYNSHNWHFLQVALDDGSRRLTLVTSDGGRRDHLPVAEVGPRLDLRIAFDGPVLRFAYREEEWTELEAERDATILSDEYASRVAGEHSYIGGFTGAFAGLWVQDLAGEGGFADFDYAEYKIL